MTPFDSLVIFWVSLSIISIVINSGVVYSSDNGVLVFALFQFLLLVKDSS